VTTGGLSLRHYLDCASATPLRPEAAAAMQAWLEAGGTGDPGRVHAEGRITRATIENARESVAGLLGVGASRLIFTSGGTEAVNAAVFGASRWRPGASMVAAAVEHSSVREASRRWAAVLEVPVDGLGRIALEALADFVGGPTEERPSLVHCQWANHEVGTLQPVAEVVALCRQARVLVHVDACAAFGHVPMDLGALDADLVSVSAHKMGGPPGIGALVLRRGVRLAPYLVGGSEERARRAGAENVVGIAGFGAACEALLADGVLSAEASRAAGEIRALVSAAVALPEVFELGDPSPEGRLPHIGCVSVGGVQGEAVLLGLDAAGIACHSGSACASEVLEPSPVLHAMGADPDRSLRVSVGWSTIEADVDAFAAAFPGVVERLRALAT
jgi:cysteine desulfurase